MYSSCAVWWGGANSLCIPGSSVRLDSVLIITDERCLYHDAGPFHPERPERLRAALDGVRDVDEELLASVVTPRRAEKVELELVHTPEMIDAVTHASSHGGRRVYAGTRIGATSLDAALFAAGSVLTAVEALANGEIEALANGAVEVPEVPVVAPADVACETVGGCR